MRPRLGYPGYYGWVVVVACFLGSLVVFGISYSFGVFFDRMLAEFGRSRGETSLVFAIQTFVVYVGAAAVGWLVDRYGTRRLLLAGAVLIALGLGGAAVSDTLWGVIVSYGVVAALGLSVVYVVSYATVPKWFERRRGFAGGVASSGLGIGMLVVAPTASMLISAYGWRLTYLLVLVLSTALLTIAAVLVADSPRRLGVDASEEFPEGYDDGSERRRLTPREQLRETLAVARSGSFLLVFFGWVCIYATLYVVFAHLVLFTADAGIGRWVGVWALGVVGGVTSLARLAIGHLSDRLGRARVFVACSTAMGLATVALAFATTPLAVFAFAVVFGAAYGGNGALLSPLTADLFGTANINVLFGLVSTAFAVSGLLAPFAAGVAYDALATYVPAFVAAGSLAVFGAGLVAWAGRRERALGGA
ncbi:MFS transporter [Halegenticoccus soli]|uniref:MFS transporter n=1 Tax=Halegenticoccus soli TaxID=1985678 RepID=UPI000C6CFEA0|nr:MFS transporter [Halegenticoccus soli]